MGKVTAIIVDDIAHARSLLKAILHRNDCDVIRELDSGSRLRDTLKNTKADIVFLDINLPGENGIELLSEIAEGKLHPYVVMISGNDDVNTITNAKKIGAKDFVAKPFNSARIAKVIKNFLLHRDESAKPRVMIADDDELMRDLLEKTLIKLGADITYKAIDGVDVMKALTTGPVPDILFLDLEMPNMGGIECLKQIKEKNIRLFCAIVSAYSSMDNVQEAIGLGANTFIVKPYTAEKIGQALKQFSATKKPAA